MGKNRRKQRRNRKLKAQDGSDRNYARSNLPYKVRHKGPNTGCEFYEDGLCVIQMDMTYCSRDCAFATNNNCSTPPYGSKYMRGGKL